MTGYEKSPDYGGGGAGGPWAPIIAALVMIALTGGLLWLGFAQ